MTRIWLIMIILSLTVVIAGSIVFLRSTDPTERTEILKDLTDIGPKRHQPLDLEERRVTLEDDSEVSFRLPSDFKINVAADNLGKARFMTFSPDGRLFVPDLVDYQLSHEGRLFVLDDFNEETGRFETKHTYLSGLRGPNSVAFYTDENGQQWLYLALTAHLVRYPYSPGDTQPSGEPEIVAKFPNEQSPGEVSVVWHITRTIFFHDDRVYVSVGSGCNSCEQLSGAMRAMIYSMDPNGENQVVEGKGLRNTVGITMANDELYATLNGVDHLGINAPHEALYKVEDGKHYGWPYCYVDEEEILPDDSQAWDTPIDCDDVPFPEATFEPRSAPLGLRYFGNRSHPSLADSFLVALHGSFEVGTGAGYEIRRVILDGSNEVFMDGFLQDGERVVRPVDFLQYDDDSFFFTDDHGGRIFYVTAS